VRASRSRLIAAGTVGYLLGTIPSADLAARAATGGRTDLRSTGSGNPGAANAIKVLGARWGYAVMAADIGKGALASAAGRRIAGHGDGAHLGGVAAVAGHCWPIWNGGRGGKGVATSVGQCLMTFPLWSAADLGVAALTAASPRWRRRAFATTVVSSVTWVAAAVVWWRRRLPNGWGPPATASLPMAAAASSAVIIQRFLVAERAA
jgi:acyl phosphate:glycerol-3-phosphate acyltransferase